MKCPICGGRKFEALHIYCDEEIYDENDELVTGRTLDHISRVEGDKYLCPHCKKEVDVVYEKE